MEHLRKLITHRIRDASTDITTARVGTFEALVSAHVLVLHTKSAVNGPGLTKLLEQAKTQDVLRPTVFLVCKLVSALKKTIKDRAADHDIELHVLTSHTGAFFSLLAVGVDAFRLPQMPAAVMLLAAPPRDVPHPATMSATDPLAIMYGAREGDTLRIIHRKGVDLDDNPHGTLSSCPIVLRQVVA